MKPGEVLAIHFPDDEAARLRQEGSKEVRAPAEAAQAAPVVEEKIDFSNVGDRAAVPGSCGL